MSQMTTLFRIVENRDGALNNKNNPVESQHTVAIFDSIELAEAYRTAKYNNEEAFDIVAFSVDLVPELGDWKNLPFNPVVMADEEQASEDDHVTSDDIEADQAEAQRDLGAGIVDDEDDGENAEGNQ